MVPSVHTGRADAMVTRKAKTQRQGGPSVTNVDEVMNNSEETEYRVTVRLGTETLATVSLSCGHVVDLARRGDGARVWVDEARQRATTPDFPVAYVPFIDECVSAWHEGTLDPGLYDYPAQLAAMAERVAAAAAAVKHASEQGRSATRRAERNSSAVKRERAELIRRVRTATMMPLGEIASALGMHVHSVERIVAGRPRG